MQNFKENVQRYIKIHKELHGKNWKWEDVARDLATSFEYDVLECLDEVERQEKQLKKDSKRYGIFIGRFMPFHIGHNAIIQDIIRDGRIPVIILGGYGKEDERHPLSYDDRINLIRKVYPMGCKFIGIKDQDNWNEWYDSVKCALTDLEINKEQIILYSHNKESDRKDFEYKGKVYQNEFYTKMFEENNVQIKTLEEFVDRKGKVVHASNIRADEEYAIRNLDARVYRTLKDKYNWWE
jgi:nicotinamide mononucleotide adenylyltransferase